MRASHGAECHNADPSIRREAPFYNGNFYMHNLLHVHLCKAGEVCLCIPCEHSYMDSAICQQPVEREGLSLIQICLKKLVVGPQVPE